MLIRNLHMDACSIFIYNSQEHKTVQMSIVGYIDKQIGTSIQWNTSHS